MAEVREEMTGPAVAPLRERPAEVRRFVGALLRLTKPGIVASNTFGAFAGWMLAAGSGAFNPRPAAWAVATLVGVALVVASGTSINNVIDRDIDRQMDRTRRRPVPAGEVSPAVALAYGAALGGVGEALLYAGVHPLVAAVTAIGWLFYVVFYSLWSKRTTTLGTLVGAVSGAAPTVAGYVAYSMRLDAVAWALFLILFLWQPVHFLAIAFRRREDYARAGLPMLPIVAGSLVAKRQMALYTLALVPASLLPALFGVVGAVYVVGALVLGAVYLALAFQGARATGAAEGRWGGAMFVFSVVYLTALYGLMVVG
ncbi:heme o synthase [Hydrogenibacillus schlegelii]|uniref:heme o synthase n=1 Tax=Hydrogenibacillus schlegelii TaxID=1484 RepID=UPI0034A00BE1